MDRIFPPLSSSVLTGLMNSRAEFDAKGQYLRLTLRRNCLALASND